MNRFKRFLTGFILIPVLFISCQKENIDNQLTAGLLHGAFISNEGLYGAGNGSVTYFNSDSDKVTSNLYYQANGHQAGDVVQSFCVFGNKGFLAVNNSGKLEVLDMNTFKTLGVVAATYPRYFLPVDSTKGYLTNGIYGGVYVVDLKNYKITNTIAVGAEPENLIRVGNYVYVANGNYGNDNTVSVIDISTDKVVKTITVDDGTVNFVADANNNVWVLCEGKVVYDASWTKIINETDSKLVCLTNNQISKSFVIGHTGDGFNPVSIAISQDKKTVYFAEKDGIYQMPVSSTTVPSKPFISTSTTSYSFEPGTVGVNPANGDIYVLQVTSYVANGKAYVFNKSGVLKTSFDTGIIPNGVTFNN